MPLVLLHAGAGVVARLDGLLAEAAVQARARQALVQVGVAQPPGPPGAAALGIVNIYSFIWQPSATLIKIWQHHLITGHW